MLDTARNLLRAATDPTLEVDAMVEAAESEIATLRMEGAKRQAWEHVDATTHDAYRGLQERCKARAEGRPIGLCYGWSDLTSMTGGLRRGDLVLVGARPAMGKSAFAKDVGLAAAEQGHAVGFINLEMTNRANVERMLSTVAKVDSVRMRDGLLDLRDRDRITEASEKLRSLGIYMTDVPSMTASEISVQARRLKASRPDLRLILVDYLQLVKGAGKERRDLDVGDISRTLRLLARELEVTVVALCQLSRSCEVRTDKRPLLSDLRDSGSLEQDADTVVFLYRDDYYRPDSPDRDVCEVLVRKCRNGKPGVVKLGWAAFRVCFTELAAKPYGIPGALDEDY